MAENSEVPYSPPFYLVSRSVLASDQITSEFEAFKQSLHYISRAPEIVFERLVGNVNETVLLRLQQQRQTQLAVFEEAEKRNSALQAKIESLEKAAKNNRELEARVKCLEAELSALRSKENNSTQRQKDNPYFSIISPGVPNDSSTLIPTTEDTVNNRRPLLFRFNQSGKAMLINIAPADNVNNIFSLYRNGGTWEDLATHDMVNRAECGSWVFKSPKDGQKTYNAEITFTSIYSEPPMVVVWLTGMEMVRGEPWRLTVFPTEITTTGFHINAKSLRTSVMLSVGVSWVAFKSTPSFITGDLTTGGSSGWKMRTDFQNIWEDSQLARSSESECRTALLVHTLEVMDIDNLSLALSVTYEQTHRFRWQLLGEKSSLNYIGASYIRIY